MKGAAFIVLAFALASPLRAQQPPKRIPPELQIQVEEPADWKPAGDPTGTRGITVAARSSIRVTGTVKHPQGIADVLLNKNRASLAPEPDGSVRFTGYVRVEEKMTSAEITVVTSAGARIPVSYSITPTTPAQPAATPQDAWVSANSGFKGKRWAVVIGISEYRDPNITPLKYAARDAKSFYDFLRSDLAGIGGFQPENIRILLDQDATYSNIRVALFDFLKNATEDDIVYIYYAGHGSPDPERLENLYLIPYDANSKQLGGTGFPMEDMNKALRQVAARHKVMITDACHSGGVASDTRAGLTLNQINESFLGQMLSSSGTYVAFTASGSNQLSQEGPQWGGGHGVFTHYLLEALRGAADADGNHIVSLGEMMETTRDRVRRETRNAQVPNYSSTAFDFNFPMALVLPGAEIAEVSTDEIREYNQVGTVMTAAYESAWLPPDSMISIAGMADTVRIRLDNEKRDFLPGKLVKWSSSNTSVATVDEEGVLTGLNGGSVLVRAEGLNRSVTIPVRMLPRPSEVAFFPVESKVQLVVGETLDIRTDLLLANNQWLRGMTPRITMSDSVVLRDAGGGHMETAREGELTLTASIAGRTKEWAITVIPPAVRIKPLRPSVPVGDSLLLGASRTRPDGTSIGDAANVIWRSSDSTKASIRNGVLYTRGIGRVTVSAFMGSSEDSATVFVLGDLLVSVAGKPGETLMTVSIGNGQSMQLLPAGMKGEEASLSPSGDRIAFVLQNRIHVMAADGSEVKRLTPDMTGVLGVRTSRYEEHNPVWTHDASRVVFISNAPGNYEVLSVNADGTDVQRLTDDARVDRNVAASPDLPRIAFERMVSATDSDLVLALPDGSQQLQFKSQLPGNLVSFGERKPKFLPGGVRLAYVRRSAGRDGESLAIMDVNQGATLRELVKPLKDNEILYAVSPDGGLIAYHQRAEWGKKNSSIVIINLEGTVLKTLSLGEGVEIRDLAWGAFPLRNQEAK